MGRTVSHYRLLDKIGDGGMGVVYQAEDLKLGRYVALKFLAEEMARDPRSVERFHREARAASALNHPNICTIYEVDEDEGQHFISMELLQGATLKQRMLGGRLNFEQMLEVALQCSDGLQAAHARGIVHRDIKPANIFITAHGQVKILDFGLAKRISKEKAAGAVNDMTMGYGEEKEQYLTATGTTWGTVAYMSPEQAQGKELDLRSDIFSFGAVLYEMATGAVPFPGDNSALMIAGILQNAPVPPSHLNPALPADLERIIRKALEKDPDLRYQSMADLRGDLRRLKRDSDSKRVAQPVVPSGPPQPQPSAPVTAPIPSPAAQARSGVSLGVVIAIVAAVLVIGVLGIGIVALALYHKSPAANIAQGADANNSTVDTSTSSTSDASSGNQNAGPGASGQTSSEQTSAAQQPQPQQQATGIFINGTELTADQVQELRATYGAVAPPGQYWYDSRSGLWGLWGHEAAGFIRPGHTFGELPENASNGNTGVFINGRQINLIEAQYIQRTFGAVYQGRWWLDGTTGNFGVEGNPTPVANLAYAFRNNNRGGDTGYRWRDGRGAVAASEGNCFIMSVPGANTVSTPGCD